MNEYSRGFLEALGWILDQLDELDDGNNEVIKELRRRVRDLCLALAPLRGGGMQDDREFKRRLGYLAIKRD